MSLRPSPGDPFDRRSDRFTEQSGLTVDGGVEVERFAHIEIPGVTFHLARVFIRQRMTYAHAVDRHMLYATIEGSSLFSKGRIAGREQIDAPDRPGVISFTPANWERSVEVGPGDLVCAHIESETGYGAGDGRARWDAPFNEPEPKLFAMIQALAQCAASGAGDALLASSLLHAVARRGAIRFGIEAPRADDGWLAPAALRRVVDLIAQDPAHAPSLPLLAAEAGLGVSAFVRAFRGTVGRTPAAFARDRRLDLVAAALRSEEVSLECLAARYGFCSPSHLVGAFRSRFGLTPRSFSRTDGRESDPLGRDQA